MRWIAFGILCAIAWHAQAAGLEYHEEGAICDRQAGICVDHMGISVALTQMYLGEVAGRDLMKKIKQTGLEVFESKTYTLHGGLTCDTKARTCWTDVKRSKVNTRATRTLFGDAAAHAAHKQSGE